LIINVYEKLHRFNKVPHRRELIRGKKVLPAIAPLPFVRVCIVEFRCKLTKYNYFIKEYGHLTTIEYRLLVDRHYTGKGQLVFGDIRSVFSAHCCLD